MGRNTDKRKIRDVQIITGNQGLKKIVALEPVIYRHIDEDGTLAPTFGFVAQDFEKEFGDLIKKRKGDDGVKPITGPGPDGDGAYSISSYEELIPILCAAVKELAAQVKEAERKIVKLTPAGTVL